MNNFFDKDILLTKNQTKKPSYHRRNRRSFKIFLNKLVRKYQRASFKSIDITKQYNNLIKMSLNTETVNKENIGKENDKQNITMKISNNMQNAKNMANENIEKRKQYALEEEKLIEKQARENKELADKILSQKYFQTKQKGKEIGEVIEEVYQRGTQEAQEMMETIKDTTVQNYGKVKERAQELGENVRNQFFDKKQEIQGDSMKFESAEEARMKGEELGQRIIDQVCQAPHKVQQKSKQAAQYARETYNQTSQKVQQKLNEEVKPAMIDKKQQIQDDAQDAKNNAKEKLSQAKKVSIQKEQGFLQKAEEISHVMYEKTANLVQNAAQSLGLKQKSEDKINKNQGNQEDNQTLLDMTTRIASQTMEVALQKGSEAWKYTKQAAGNLSENIKLKASDASEESQEAQQKLKQEMGLKPSDKEE